MRTKDFKVNSKFSNKKSPQGFRHSIKILTLIIHLIDTITMDVVIGVKKEIKKNLKDEKKEIKENMADEKKEIKENLAEERNEIKETLLDLSKKVNSLYALLSANKNQKLD